jgi:glycerol-3-phosphate dehydrogenase (NAD(P)+)
VANDDLKVAVVGAGSWGTAFATIPAINGVETVLWARREELAEEIGSRHENSAYLPGIALPSELAATHDLEKAVGGAKILVMAVPSHGFREAARQVAPFITADTYAVSLTKGLEQETLQRMTEVMQEEFDIPPWSHAALTGPNLAKEIASGQPAAAVIGCEDEECAALLQKAFNGAMFRVYTNPDVVGCELAGAIKNVIAIAAGIADGMGFGDNSKAALITRGLIELARLGRAMGGKPLTFAGLAGMGDLIATCTSPLSRNHHVGEALGKGKKLDDIIAEMNMVAEGVKTSRVVVEMAQRQDLPMPISEHVVKVLYEGMSSNP